MTDNNLETFINELESAPEDFLTEYKNLIDEIFTVGSSSEVTQILADFSLRDGIDIAREKLEKYFSAMKKTPNDAWNMFYGLVQQLASASNMLFNQIPNFIKSGITKEVKERILSGAKKIVKTLTEITKEIAILIGAVSFSVTVGTEISVTFGFDLTIPK